MGLPSRPSKEPSIRHKRMNHPTRDDFADYTHEHPAYQDKYVHPNNVVDAPRIQAIRGRDDGNNSAIITSVGTRTMLDAQLPGAAAAAAPPPIDVAADEPADEATSREQIAAQKSPQSSSAPNAINAKPAK